MSSTGRARLGTLADLDDVLEDGELPALSEDARRHELVLNELLRRPNNG